MKRFWDDVSLAEDAGEFRVLLDGKAMHLPNGGVLRVGPPALAAAIAEEWRQAGGQKGGEMSYLDTPLTRVAGTARERIARLPAGVALWCVGGRCFEVRHHLSDREWELIDTDQAMGQRRATPRAAEPPEYEQLALVPEGAV